MEGNDMYVFGIVILMILPPLFLDWHGVMVFLARGYCRCYGHGKSFNRAKRHYKTNWSFIQRIQWIPLFKEQYDVKYKGIAYFSYLHRIMAILTIICFLVDELILLNVQFWHYIFILLGALFIIRFVYNNHIAIGK